MVEFLRKEQYRAKKDHICHLCGKTIRKGREYIYEVSKYEGMVNDCRRHIHCDALADVYFGETGVTEYTDEEICEYLCDKVCSRCPERETSDCSMWDAFGCELVQKELLKPTVFAAAKRSVWENSEDMI